MPTKGPKKPSPFGVGRNVRCRAIRGPKDGRWYWRAERHKHGRKTVWSGWATAAEGSEDDPLTDVAPAMSKEMHAQFEEERFKSKQLIYGGLVVIAVLIVLSLLW